MIVFFHKVFLAAKPDRRRANFWNTLLWNLGKRQTEKVVIAIATAAFMALSVVARLA